MSNSQTLPVATKADVAKHQNVFFSSNVIFQTSKTEQKLSKISKVVERIHVDSMTLSND